MRVCARHAVLGAESSVSSHTLRSLHSLSVICHCPSEKSRTCLSRPPPSFHKITLFSLPEQYKLLSDHIEQMATE